MDSLTGAIEVLTVAVPQSTHSTQPTPFEISNNKYDGMGIGSPKRYQNELEDDESEGGESDRRNITIKPNRTTLHFPPPFKNNSFTTIFGHPNDPSVDAVDRRHQRLQNNIQSLEEASIVAAVLNPINQHPTIPSPVYVQRSQPFQLQRSNTSPNSSTVNNREALRRSESNSSIGSNLSQGEVDRSSTITPTSPDSLSMTSNSRESSLKDLPANPKQWLPSHLSLYLTHLLRLHPLLAADITTFIRSSALSGRTFLRLHDDDMVEMGINVRWRKALSEARETLRRQALGGRIWGFGVNFSATARNEMNLESGMEAEEEEKADWKKSWRLIKGKKSTKTRVKGMRSAFEGHDAPEVPSIPKQHQHKASTNGGVLGYRPPHVRSDSISSNASSASIDSGNSNDDEFSPVSSPMFRSKSSSTQASSSAMYRSMEGEIMMFKDASKSRGLEEEVATVKSNSKSSIIINPSSAPDTNSRGSLSELFGLTELKGSSGRTGTGSRSGPDLLATKLGDGKGSMIVVKRSQLLELEQRMSEVEAQLAAALASSELSIDQSLATAEEAKNWIKNAGVDSLAQEHSTQTSSTEPSTDSSKSEAAKRELPRGWLGLGGYVLAASLGIGIIAGEVVVTKLIGAVRRS